LKHSITKMSSTQELTEANDTNVKQYENWDDLELNEDVTRGIYAYGFEHPTPIQGRAIKPLVAGRDLIGQAQSGTGKTGSFTIGTLQSIDTSKKTTQALILSPTQTLAQQTAKVVTALSQYMDGLVIKTLVGGTSVSEDVNELRSNTPHVIVGTAGRVFDMMKRRNFDTGTIKLFVLDEADEMLSRGFKDQIYEIFKYFSDDVQIALFSATMPEEILTLTDKFMRNPVKITLKPQELTLECIQQYHIALQNDQEKYDTLQDLFEIISTSQCIIYVGAVKRVADLYTAMIADGYTVCQIHSEIPHAERNETIKQFRNGAFRVMISSGMTARGFDVQQVSTVINFDIGRNIDTYLHAIGRAGRFGRKGLAINFVTKQDMDHLKKLEQHYNITIPELPSNIETLM
jgi:translation initiation factor 4A